MPCLMRLTQLFLPFCLSLLLPLGVCRGICISCPLRLSFSPSVCPVCHPCLSSHLPLLPTTTPASELHLSQFSSDPGVGRWAGCAGCAPLFGFIVSASLSVSLLKKSQLPTAVPFLLNSAQPILCLLLDSILSSPFCFLRQSLMKHRLASYVPHSQG